MSGFCLYFEMEDYLAQWFIHEQGGFLPVRLFKGSAESIFLELNLRKSPADEPPESPANGNVAVAIPTFRNLPPTVYNYLGQRAKAAFISILRDRFDLQLWGAIHKFGKLKRDTKKALIEAFMENKGIEITDKNWNAVDKRYNRMREEYEKCRREKSRYEKSKG